MDLLIHIGTPQAEASLEPLGRACARAGIRWACFLTHDGVKVLESMSLIESLETAESVIVCMYAWKLHMNGKSCPATFGSQSDNSLLMAQAGKVISL